MKHSIKPITSLILLRWFFFFSLTDVTHCFHTEALLVWWGRVALCVLIKSQSFSGICVFGLLPLEAISSLIQLLFPLEHNTVFSNNIPTYILEVLSPVHCYCSLQRKWDRQPGSALCGEKFPSPSWGKTYDLLSGKSCLPEEYPCVLEQALVMFHNDYYSSSRARGKWGYFLDPQHRIPWLPRESPWNCEIQLWTPQFLLPVQLSDPSRFPPFSAQCSLFGLSVWFYSSTCFYFKKLLTSLLSHISFS